MAAQKSDKIFRQFFDMNSSTYTYLIGDIKQRSAALIDTVLECVQRELQTIRELDFDQIYLISTHVHADHVTGNAAIKRQLESKVAKCVSVLSKHYEEARADVYVDEGDTIDIGSTKLHFLHTPGHTSGCMSIVDHEHRRVFTGDALLARGCGRTDFQGGDSGLLYDSVQRKLFTLPPDYTVYPAHDYKGVTASSIGEEVRFNPRLSKSKDEFIEIMKNLNLAYPKLIDIAVPRNLNCGYEAATAAPSNGD